MLPPFYVHRQRNPHRLPSFGFFMNRSGSVIQTTASLTLAVMVGLFGPVTQAADLAERLQALSPSVIAAQSQMRGDPVRGSIIFHTSAAGCIKCHADGSGPSPLGPRLPEISPDASDAYLIEAILQPSRSIREGYETIAVVGRDGRVRTGVIASQNDDQVVLRELSDLLHPTVIPRHDIDEIEQLPTSMMPAGLVNSLRSERDFYDLLRYVFEVVRGGGARAAALRPAPEDLIIRDDSIGLDHAGILRSLGDRDLTAGKQIYLGHCKNCHGADGNQPTLPLARAFGHESLRSGGDPYRMFLTLTKGSGLMAPVRHLSPKERYQVIHFIREQLMKPSNPDYTPIDEAYLTGLPPGTSSGKQSTDGPRDFGPALGSQIGTRVHNALTIRLDDTTTAAYDLHQMGLVGVWKDGFLDLSNTQHYRQRGEQMPKISGSLLPGMDGWQWAFAGGFDLPADAKPPRGPLREDLMRYEGHSLYGNNVILRYAIEGRDILESPGCRSTPSGDCIEHTLRIGPGRQSLALAVARLPEPDRSSGVYSTPTTPQPQPRAAATNHVAFLAHAATPSARHLVPPAKAAPLDLGTVNRTILVRFRTSATGTLIASAPEQGNWVANGKTLFLRDDELVFDIGWVGAIRGKAHVRDGQWHTAAVVVRDTRTALFVDGRLLGERPNFRRPPVSGHVLKIGSTAADFGGDFGGEIAWARIYSEAVPATDLAALAGSQPAANVPLAFQWEASAAPVPANVPTNAVAATVVGETTDCTWEVRPDGRMVLTIPPTQTSRTIRIAVLSARQTDRKQLIESVNSAPDKPVADLQAQLRGGPRRWPEMLTLRGRPGESINGYALDTIPVPFENPWNAWLRTSALDFFPDGRAVVTTHGGDVYLVSGIDRTLHEVTWQRFAAGLFEPFGVRVVDGLIYVTCRDGIKRLHDENGDGEADFIEAFWNDDDVSCMFHAYNFDLQTDEAGNFYFAKAGQYTHHHRPGTIMKVPPEGGRAEVVAWGFRTPNGMGRLADGRFTVSDNQGPWMPAGKISVIEPGGFYGNMPTTAEQEQWLRGRNHGELPTGFTEPFIWMPQELDNSCGGQVWIADPRFGPLAGRLLHASFGKGWLYSLSMQEIAGQTQAAIIALPHQWRAGVMRLRVNPADGQVYGTGLSGWQGPAGGEDGCFQRLRSTGEKCRLIDSMSVTPTGLRIRFSFPLDPQAATAPGRWQAEMWDYLWSKKYGSEQFSVLRPGKTGRDRLTISAAALIDPQTVEITLPQLKACDQLFVKMAIRDSTGEPFTEEVYLTIHAVPMNVQ